jgi:hypothetical protein
MATFTDRFAGINSSVALKAPVRVATTANITLSGFQTIDGVTLASGDANLRVLVKGQADSTQNGLYDVASGNWTRTTDWDGNTDFVQGSRIFVYAGAAGAGMWVMNAAWTATSQIGVVGNPITFVPAASYDLGITLPTTVNAVPRFSATTGRMQNSGVTIDDSNNLVANSLSAAGGVASFSAGGNRAFMDFAGGAARIGSIDGGGAATKTKFYSGGVLFLDTGANAGVTDLFWGTSNILEVTPGNPANGPGGNTFDGGILTHSVTGDHQVAAYHVAQFSGLPAEWGPITEYVSHRVYGGTDFERISFTSMAAWAGPALNDAAADYRIQMEAGGTGTLRPLKITTQDNDSGLSYEYQTFQADGNVRFFRRTDSPGDTGNNLAVILGQQARGIANVLTANGTQDSPKLVWESSTYDGSLHTSAFKAYTDATSNAGAANWILSYQLDAGSEVAKLVVTSAGAFLPGSNDGGALGGTANQWSDLFLASGAVFNIANGDWVATHSTGILTVGTGDLRVTTAGTNAASVVTNNGSQTLVNKVLTAPDINAGTVDSLTSLSIRSTGAAFDLTFASTEVLTAGRTLTLKVNDAARTIDLSGNLTLAGAASLPAIAQGNLWYGSATGVISALAKDTGSSRFLKNSGSSNNPAWVQPAASDLSNGVQGSGAVVLATSPTLTTPVIATGTPTTAATLGYTAGTLTFGDGAANHVIVSIDQTFTLTNKTLDSLRVSSTASQMGASAKTFTNAADSTTNIGHYFAISLNGTTYYVPCSSVAPTG